MNLNNAFKLMFAMVFIGIAGASFAAPTIGVPETWSGGDESGWNVSGDADPLTNPGVGGSDASPNGYLQITLGDALSSAKVFAGAGSSGGNFVGDYYSVRTGGPLNGSLMAEFNFIALDNQASGLALYFQSATRSWMTTLASPTVGAGWTHFSVTIGSFENWTMMGGDAPGNFTYANWVSDMGNVLEMGLSIYGNLGAGEQYGLDDFGLEYYVPEPETIWMLLAVVVSLGITYRGRVIDVVGQLKTRLYKA